MDGGIIMLGVDGPPSSMAFKRAVLKYPPREFSLDVLPPAKHGSAYSYGLRVSPIKSDTATINSGHSWSHDYEIWRRWEDCLNFQEILEQEYAEMSKEKRRGLASGKGIKKGGVYQRSDFASSWDSLPPGPDPSSVARDIHAYLPRLSKKGSIFRINQATIAQRGKEFEALIKALWDSDPPTLVKELRQSSTVRDFFGFWRRDSDRLKRSGIAAPTSPSLYSTVSVSAFSLVPTSPTSADGVAPMLLKLKSDDNMSITSRDSNNTITPNPLATLSPSGSSFSYSRKRESDDSTLESGSLPLTPNSPVEGFGGSDPSLKFVLDSSDIEFEEPAELTSTFTHRSADFLRYQHQQRAATNPSADAQHGLPSPVAASAPRPPRRGAPPALTVNNRSVRILPASGLASPVEEDEAIYLPHFDWPTPPASLGTPPPPGPPRSVLLANSRRSPLSATTFDSSPQSAVFSEAETDISSATSLQASSASSLYERKRAKSLVNPRSSNRSDGPSRKASVQFEKEPVPSIRDSIASLTSIYTQSSAQAGPPRHVRGGSGDLRRSLSSGSRRHAESIHGRTYDPSMAEEESLHDSLDFIDSYLEDESAQLFDSLNLHEGNWDARRRTILHDEPARPESMIGGRDSINFSLPSPHRYSSFGSFRGSMGPLPQSPSSIVSEHSAESPLEATNLSPTFVVKAIFQDSIIVLKVDRTISLHDLRHRIHEKFSKQEDIPLSETLVLGYVSPSPASPEKRSSGGRPRSNSDAASFISSVSTLDIGRVEFVTEEEQWQNIKATGGAKMTIRIFDSLSDIAG
ncbi:hypothetical protein SISNIDRAFT_114016 [Sistotremastrum niveocremeum HHB9708]|uniref:PX domain-containing protein n=1 Tax=Sistotremastrum niveocremeum HHB9708 TaxID=1314777 RepID=A0A164TKU8_9AGAM|nr:hypothetical protein SISNIDRAFT_114016 [Sistotremastrum niveocremeum HHB9708]